MHAMSEAPPCGRLAHRMRWPRCPSCADRWHPISARIARPIIPPASRARQSPIVSGITCGSTRAVGRHSAPAVRREPERFAMGLSLGSRLVATERYVPFRSGLDRPGAGGDYRVASVGSKACDPVGCRSLERWRLGEVRPTVLRLRSALRDRACRGLAGSVIEVPVG